MVVIGIDGGGTKTRFTLFDASGVQIHNVLLESCHILQRSKDEIVRILQSGIHMLLEQGDYNMEDVMICAGLAGYGNDAGMRCTLEEICEKAFSPYSYIIRNDSQIALEGALDGEDGILLIAGTGSIAIGKLNDTQIRCGGWGYMLGDEGSAYAIGKALLAHYCHQVDGRENQTILVDAVQSYCKLQDPYGIIPYVANTLGNRREEIAKLAMLTASLAQQKDPTACAIFQEAGLALAKLANTLKKQYAKDTKLSYIGGVWKSGNIIMDEFLANLDEGIQVQAPLQEPVYGAYRLAIESFQKNKIE